MDLAVQKVYELYKTGLEALRSMRKSQGLTLKRAEDVRAKMEDLIEEGDDIAAVLSQGWCSCCSDCF